jgi:hypothetical protein
MLSAVDGMRIEDWTIWVRACRQAVRRVHPYVGILDSVWHVWHGPLVRDKHGALICRLAWEQLKGEGVSRAEGSTGRRGRRGEMQGEGGGLRIAGLRNGEGQEDDEEARGAHAACSPCFLNL